MTKNDKSKYLEFVKALAEEYETMPQRVPQMLRYLADKHGMGASPVELRVTLQDAGLGSPATGRIRAVLLKDRRLVKEGGDSWKAKPNDFKEKNKTISLNNVKEREVQTISFSSYVLHPKILQVTELQFLSGDYRGAILNAFIEVVHQVKIKTNYPVDHDGRELDGDKLVQHVFGCDSNHAPLLRLNSLRTSLDRAEQRGIMNLFKGVIGIRDRKAHVNFIQSSPIKTMEYLALASLLVRLLDESESTSV